MVIGMRLLVDDGPLVRTLAMKTTSSFLRVEFRAELPLFRELGRRLAKGNPGLLFARALNWLGEIATRAKTDTHGEALTIFVDEFFIAKEFPGFIGVAVERPASSVESLVAVRWPFRANALAALESYQ
jgi:hypothetical protein